MQISELIVTLHHELMKSYNFINETRGNENPETSVLHISIERVEIELPVTLSEQDMDFDPNKMKGFPDAFKKLFVPFTDYKGRLPKKSVKGKTIATEIVGHIEKLDDRLSPEAVGRIKITFKPVIS